MRVWLPVLFATGALALLPRQTPAPTPKIGDECFAFTTTSTTECFTATEANTPTCTPTEIVIKNCQKGFYCSLDQQHQDVCMVVRNKLDTGGIVIAIVFGSAVVLGMAYLTFASCRERRQHRKMAAKAEAVALARAATKKQRVQEVRAPLMADGSNPFHDQTR